MSNLKEEILAIPFSAAFPPSGLCIDCGFKGVLNV